LERIEQEITKAAAKKFSNGHNGDLLHKPADLHRVQCQRVRSNRLANDKGHITQDLIDSPDIELANSSPTKLFLMFRE
jgi:hypothetical protein